MGKNLRISSNIRKPLITYDFAPDPIWISLYIRKVLFSFLSVYLISRLFLFIKRLPAPGQILSGQLAPCLFLDERPVLLYPDLEGGAAHSTGRFLLRRRLLFLLLSLSETGDKNVLFFYLKAINFTEYVCMDLLQYVCKVPYGRYRYCHVSYFFIRISQY